ncbi:MAG: glycosyltransferase [Chitinophagales bacterium]|nr:glycosyltransferase [Chitinophagales bacterium]
MNEAVLHYCLPIQIVCIAFLLFHYVRRKLPATPTMLPQQNHEPISIIICAHNEAKNLEENLPRILAQQHLEATVIVVNDRSTDHTADVLATLASTHPQLHIIEVSEAEKNIPGKKLLLLKALQAATTEKIIVTDADCFPASTLWAAHMSTYLNGNTRLVLGFSPFYQQRSLLNKFIRFEATQTAWLYFSEAAQGNAYMGVGRNMAFYKSDFLQWFQNTTHAIAGGDDDLFVNATATQNNVALCLQPDSFVFTHAATSWQIFFRQKARHVQAAYYYKKQDQLLLFLFALAQFLTIAIPICSILHLPLLMLSIPLWLTLQTALSFKAYKKFAQTDLVKWIPLLQLIFIFYLLIVFLLSLLKGKKTWN